MKKIALSLAVLAASGAYVAQQWGADPGDALLGMGPANADAATATSEPLLPAQKDPAPAAVSLPEPSLPGPSAPLPGSREPANPAPLVSAALAVPPAPPAPQPAEVAAVAAPTPPPADTAALDVAPAPLAPRPRPRPHLAREAKPIAMPVSMTVAAAGGLADGTYTGPAVDAYYGMVQIQAIVRQGHLAGIKVLQYPSDRRTSIAINRQALPMLRDEAIAAQSGNVDIVSGATLTSEAFARSLKGALRQAAA